MDHPKRCEECNHEVLSLVGWGGKGICKECAARHREEKGQLQDRILSIITGHVYTLTEIQTILHKQYQTWVPLSSLLGLLRTMEKVRREGTLYSKIEGIPNE